MVKKADIPKLKCWQVRGCPSEMEENCPFGMHSLPCELPCLYTYCPTPESYQPLRSISQLDGVDIDKGGAVKERCWGCEIYLNFLRKDG